MQPACGFAAAKSSARTGLPASGCGAGGDLCASSARSIAYRSPFMRDAGLGVGRVAAAVAAVDRLVGVQEEHVPGQVVVELEAAQVHPGDLDQADADELVGDFGDVLVETNNLLVDRGAVASGLAAEDEEDRLAGPLRLGLRGGVVGVPAVLGGVELARLGLGACRAGRRASPARARCMARYSGERLHVAERGIGETRPRLTCPSSPRPSSEPRTSRSPDRGRSPPSRTRPCPRRWRPERL